MAFYSYVITKTAYEDIKKLDTATKKKLKNRLEFLIILDDPLSRAIKLPDPRQGTYRWTIGDYRVIFDVHKRKVIVLRVQHRSEVYNNWSKQPHPHTAFLLTQGVLMLNNSIC